MIKPRRSADRGHANHGWLDSHHTFSFGGYYDAAFTGFRDLLVINEDRVTPAAGFGTHGHKDMEIVSYVLEGALAHKDSLGTGSVLKPGDVQRMSAGTGVRHSEFNGSETDPLHFLQIWITPQKEGVPPSYEEKHFSNAEKNNRLRLLVSPDGQDGSLHMNQNARIYASLLEENNEVNYEFSQGRFGWIQVARGTIEVDGVTLTAGDGAAINDEKNIRIKAQQNSEFLVFDLA